MRPEDRQPPEPWHSFFQELDATVDEQVDIQCIGGFVVTTVYGLPRPTSDIDVVSLAPREAGRELLENGQQGSELHRKHHVYLQYVGVAALPYNYEDRLVEVFQGTCQNLRLFVLDAYDLALSKLDRNQPKDREDVRFLARVVPLDLDTLKRRYQEELRPNYFGVKENLDANFSLWVEMIEEDRQRLR